MNYLQSQQRISLETEIRLESLHDLPYQTLERKFRNKQFRGFLILSDFLQRQCSRAKRKIEITQSFLKFMTPNQSVYIPKIFYYL